MVAALPLLSTTCGQRELKERKNPKTTQIQNLHDHKNSPQKTSTRNKDKTKRKPRVQNQTNTPSISLVVAALSKNALQQLELRPAGTHRETSPFHEEKQQAASRGNSDFHAFPLPVGTAGRLGQPCRVGLFHFPWRDVVTVDWYL